MTSAYRKEHEAGYGGFADPVLMVTTEARTVINNAASFFEGQADTDDTPVPSEGERLALKRAMARFLIDSGIAGARSWLS